MSKDAIVAMLRDEWSSLSGLLAGLDDSEWAAPALPGWTVHDVVAHLAGVERTLAGDAGPSLRDGVEAPAHVRNEPGKMNEAWVEHYRTVSNAELLADFNRVTDRRLAALAVMTAEEFDAPSWTPVGQATYARFMRVRIFDCWMHEQDIRHAVARPGHEDGIVAAEALEEVVGALGYIAGKRVGVPDGAAVTIHLTGPPVPRDLNVVVDGKARLVEALDRAATASITLSTPLFMRLAGGRIDPASVRDQIQSSGDPELALRLATKLAYTI